MEKRKLGATDIEVTVVGFGAGEVGSRDLPEKDAEKLLHTVLDSGVNLVDTARGYGLSEERIGKYLSGRRDEFILSTKVGYDVEGVPDWTYDTITKGVERALKHLRTDYLDIVHLHSCPKETLEEGSVIDALEKMKDEGKIRYMAYSGDAEPLEFAVSLNRFDSIMASVNICDQRAIDYPLPQAREKNLGVISKRPALNICWRYKERPDGQYAEVYWDRWQSMALYDMDMDPLEMALRFAAYTPGVDSIIPGTTNPAHWNENIGLVNKGPLPKDIYNELRKRFAEHDLNWLGQV